MNRLGKLVRVQTAEHLEGFRTRLTFEDGTVEEKDLAPYLWGTIFEPIRKDPAQFHKMRIEGGTIAWDNGADIDPDPII